MSKTVPLENRPGFREEPNHALVKALRELRETHGLAGCVLISFDADMDTVGANSSGATPAIGAAMHWLGDRVLTAIDDGQFDPNKMMAN